MINDNIMGKSVTFCLSQPSGPCVLKETTQKKKKQSKLLMNDALHLLRLQNMVVQYINDDEVTHSLHFVFTEPYTRNGDLGASAVQFYSVIRMKLWSTWRRVIGS